MSTEPIITQGTTLPPQLRNAPAATQQAYATAVSFEQVLMNQLSSSLSAAAQSDDGSSDDSANSDPFASLIPQALSTSLTQGPVGDSLTSALMADFGSPMPTSTSSTSSSSSSSSDGSQT